MFANRLMYVQNRGLAAVTGGACAFAVLALVPFARTVRAAEVTPIAVTVEQTPGGPRLCVDGRPVAPRAFYGTAPSIGFISEFREYDFTLPFTAKYTTDAGNLRIAFNPNRTTYWLRNARLETDDGSAVLACAGTFATEAAFRAAWTVRGEGAGCAIGHTNDAVVVTRLSEKPFELRTTVPLPLVAGRKYRFKFAIRANQGRQFFTPSCHQANPANGRWERCPLSYGDTFADTVRLAGESGADIVTGEWGYGWHPPDAPADKWAASDAVTRKLIAANPKVLFIPRVNASAPAWYLKRHPEIRNVYDNGFVAGTGSLSDPQYRRDACAHIEEVTRHLRKTFPRNFAGLHVAGQNSGEWFYENAFDPPLGGYEVSTRDGFRRWLRARGDPAWATAEVPSSAARRDLSAGFLLHPTRDRRLLDFAIYRQEDVASFISELGAAIGRGSDNQVLKLSFYGYSWEIAGTRNGPSATGHYALEWLMKNGRENIDALSAPFSYSNRKWPGSTPVMSSAETLARHGILWFNEDDTRTYLEDIWDYKTACGGKRVNKAETLDLLTKNAALEIMRGLGDWWMDLFGRGWYRDADLWALRRRLAPLDEALRNRRTPYEPEIALVMDEASMNYLKPGVSHAINTLVARRLFDSCGAPYGQYFLNDILDNPPKRAKIFFIAFAFRLTAEQRAKVASLRRARPDATFVWCWAPGYITETDFSLETMREATGFTFAQLATNDPQAVSTEAGLRAGLGHPTWGGALGRDIRPLFSPKVEPGDEVWSVYRAQPDAPALMRRPHRDGVGSDIYLGPCQLFPQLVRTCVETAGVHCYAKGEQANVAAAEGFVYVQAIVDGPIEVDFGVRGEVVDFLTGESIGRGPKLAVPFRKGEARIFKTDCQQNQNASALHVSATVVPPQSADARTGEVLSPDGRLMLSVEAAPEGLNWSLSRDGQPLVLSSRLGLDFATKRKGEGGEPGALGPKMKILSVTRADADARWTTRLSRRADMRDRYREMTVTLEEIDANAIRVGMGQTEVVRAPRRLTLVCRAYDEGVAFRYAVPEQTAFEGFELLGELTEWRFADDPEVWTTTYRDEENSQEAPFVRSRLSAVDPKAFVGMPVLVRTGHATLALCEAALSNWAGLYYRAKRTPSEAPFLAAHLTRLPRSSASTPNAAVIAMTPARSPWRVVLVGDDELDLLRKNGLLANLNPPPDPSIDFSWVKPGATSWDWWTESNNSLSTELTLRLVDFAAEMGWPYHTIDGGWYGFDRRPNHGPNVPLRPRRDFDLARIVRHATERGVGIWVWIHWQEIEDTGIEETFARLEGWGVKGVKTDFLNRQDQWMVCWYEKVLRAAARHRILVNFHGAFKPTGTERTWPNNLTREGVCGNEMNLFSTNVTPAHVATLPFTRFLLGPGDFTPGSFANVHPKDFVPQSKKGHRYGDETDRCPHWAEEQGTRAHALALPFVFDSPLTTLCDWPERYRGQAGLEAFRALPTTWRRTEPLAGEIGRHYVVAREAFDGRWFVAAITVGPRNEKVPLRFLGAGVWTATVYSDDPARTPADARALRIVTRRVTSAETLDLPLADAGGAVVILSRP